MCNLITVTGGDVLKNFTQNFFENEKLSAGNYLLNIAGLYDSILEHPLDLSNISANDFFNLLNVGNMFIEPDLNLDEVASGKKGKLARQSFKENCLKEKKEATEIMRCISLALLSNLPEDEVEKDEKINSRCSQEEFTLLFKYQSSDFTCLDAKEKINVLETLIDKIDNSTFNEKRSLLNKEITYVKLSQEKSQIEDRNLENKYMQMIKIISNWQPTYQNNENKDLEKIVMEYLEYLKNRALQELRQARSNDCYLNNENDIEKEFELKLNTLKRTSPEDFCVLLKYRIKNLIANIEQTISIDKNINLL